MSQYIKLLQHNGGFISVLADDDGVIQYTTNDADYAGIPAEAAHADNATTADGPTVAATFLNDLTAIQDTITTLGSAAADLDITGLAGDTDGDYEFSGVLLLTGNASANIVTLQPENLNTDQSGRTVFASNGNQAVGSDVGSLLLAGPTNTADSTCAVWGTLSSKSGRTRVFTGKSTSTQTNGDSFGYDTMAYWTGTATAITKLRFHSTITLGFRAGSFIRLRRLHNLS